MLLAVYLRCAFLSPVALPSRCTAVAERREGHATLLRENIVSEPTSSLSRSITETHRLFLSLVLPWKPTACREQMERVDAGTRLAAHLLIHSLTHSTVPELRAFPSHSTSGFSAVLNKIKEERKTHSSTS